MPGPGKFFIKVDKMSAVVRAWMFNYEVNSAVLKYEHTKLLDDAFVPVIKGGGNIKLLGIASTTGTDAFNKQLSAQRVAGVEKYLKDHAGLRFNISKSLAMGEVMARAFDDNRIKGGTKDNVESEVWRGVVINAWNRDLPPPPPPGIDVPFENSSWASTVGDVLDKTALVVTLVDAAAELFEIAALSAVTGPLGLILGTIQTIAGMPLLLHNEQQAANTNGRIEGLADAIQDMCDQFTDPDLPKVPMSKWPAIKVPAIHFSTKAQTSANEDAWRTGQSRGLQDAVQKVLDLENNPKPVTLSSGKHVKISGRMWLWIASQNHKDNCGVELVIKPVNEELRKQGKRPWPTR
jgi:hypothetical protein